MQTAKPEAYRHSKLSQHPAVVVVVVLTSRETPVALVAVVVVVPGPSAEPARVDKVLQAALLLIQAVRVERQVVVVVAQRQQAQSAYLFLPTHGLAVTEAMELTTHRLLMPLLAEEVAATEAVLGPVLQEVGD
jgi:phosphoribosyl-dephospho-CoA transferase